MLAWMQSLDAALFRFINGTLSCPALDVLMPLIDNSPAFIPAAALMAILLLWRSGVRGRLFVVMLALILSLGDTLVTAPMKHLVGRLRPFNDILDAHVLVGRGSSGSFPSGHTSLWFAAAFIANAFYPRTRWVLFPFAALMAFSRVYLGVHYPGDVLFGGVIGAGYAAAFLWGINATWQTTGRKWFPIWWTSQPCLVLRGQGSSPRPSAFAPEEEGRLREAQYVRLGCLWILLALAVRLGYIASGLIQLSEDEAYQWLWSKNLALSYWSKPPLIAYTQWLGTHLWGDTAFGVRFFSPVIAAGLSLMMLRFMARVATARLGFLLVLIVTVTPLLSIGSVLLTVDPLLVLFWTAAMVAGWRAVQPDGATRHWVWTGLWMGLGFLSKYTALLQIVCWMFFFVLWKPARAHLRRPGPWLALGVFAVCMLPVVLWNAEHDWITVHHVATNAKLEKPWKADWDHLKHFPSFLGTEAGLLHPIFFVASLWALFGVWKRRHDRPLWLYFFAMGAPVFFGYALFALHSQVQANWIAAAVVPMFCLMAVYWDERWREGRRAVQGWLVAALGLGFVLLPLLHETDLTWKIARVRLPADKDPLRRVRGIKGISDVIAGARRELLKEGKEVFVITPHYGPASQVTFYLPEARLGLPDSPLVYARVGAIPKSQFFFWRQYRFQETRKGQNAIFFVLDDEPTPPPPQLLADFDSVTDGGLVEVKHDKRVFHHVRLFVCRNLR